MSKKVQKRRRMVGQVVSDKMEKTVVVEIKGSRLHPLYQKRYQTKKRVLADDPENKFKPGDRVLIEESRSLSRHKSFRVIKKFKAV